MKTITQTLQELTVRSQTKKNSTFAEETKAY